MPNRLEFEEDIALFLELSNNPVVLSIQVITWIVYILLLLCLCIQDRQDEEKWRKTIPLSMISSPYLCAYEVEIYTALKANAGTTANVNVILIGEVADSDTYTLSTDKGGFQRASVCRFVIWSRFNLGHIQKLLLWHDGQGSNPDWFISRAVVSELNGTNRFYFLCNEWLHKMSSDMPNTKPEFGLYDVISNCELHKYHSLFNTTTHDTLRDMHLAINVFKRRFLENIGRAEKITVFHIGIQFLIFASLLFFGIPEEQELSQVDVGIFRINGQQIGVVVKSLFVAFFFTIIFAFLFGNIQPMPLVKKSQTKLKIRVNEEKKHKNLKGENRTHGNSTNVPINKKTDKLQAAKKPPSHEDDEVRRVNEADKMLALVSKDIHLDTEETYMRETEVEKPSAVGKAKEFVLNQITGDGDDPVLPHWFFWPIHAISFITSVLLTFLSILYGLKFGKQKSYDWLMSIVEGVFGELFIEDPLKLFVVVVIFVLLTKSDTLANLSHVYEVEGQLEMVMQKRRHRKKNSDPITHPETFVNYKEQAVFIDKQRLTLSQHEFIGWRIFTKVCPIILYISAMFISHGINSGFDFTLVHTIKGIIESPEIPASGTSLPSIYTVKSYKDFWSWFEMVFLPSLDIKQSNSSHLPSILGHSTILVGPIRLRQLRMAPYQCTVEAKVEHVKFPVRCFGKYSIHREIREDFFPGWTVKSTSNETHLDKSDIKEKSGWNYFYSNALGGRLYHSPTFSYSGGGYVADIMPQDVSVDVNRLKKNAWLDNNTKALFVEFSTYTANVDAFVQAQILFAKNSGRVDAEYHLNLVHLHRIYTGPTLILDLVCEVVVVIFSLCYMYIESKRIMFHGKDYLYTVWNVLNLLVIIIKFLSIVYYAKLLLLRYEFEFHLTTFDLTYLHELSELTSTFCELTGFLICLLSIQIVKLFSGIRYFSSVSSALEEMIRKVSVPMLAIFAILLASTAAFHFYFISFAGVNMDRPDTSLLTLLRAITRSSHSSTPKAESSMSSQLISHSLLAFTVLSAFILLIYSKTVLLHAYRKKKNTMIIMEFIRTNRLPQRITNMIESEKKKKH